MAERERSLIGLIGGNLDRWFGPVADPGHRDLLQRHAQGGAYGAWFGSAGTRLPAHAADMPPFGKDPASVAAENTARFMVRPLRPTIVAGPSDRAAGGRERAPLAIGIAVSEAPSRSEPDEGARGREADATASETMLVRLDGFEGPLDLLLDLARRQEVDTQPDFGAGFGRPVSRHDRAARRGRDRTRARRRLVGHGGVADLAEVAAAAAEKEREGRGAERAAGVLVDRLAQIERVRALADWLEARPQLGRETYARGAPEAVSRTVVSDLPALFRACLVGLHWQPPIRRSTVPPEPILWRVSDAIARLRAMIGAVPDGTELTRFFPPHLFGVIAAGR